MDEHSENRLRRSVALMVVGLLAFAGAVGFSVWNRSSTVSSLQEVQQPLCEAVRYQNHVLHVEHVEKLHQHIPSSFFPSIPHDVYVKLTKKSHLAERTIVGGLTHVRHQLDRVGKC